MGGRRIAPGGGHQAVPHRAVDIGRALMRLHRPSAVLETRDDEPPWLGRRCKPHWNESTSALRKAALARRAAEGEAAPAEPEPAAPPIKKRARRAPKPIAPGPGRRATPEGASPANRPSEPRAPTRGLLRSVGSLATVIVSTDWLRLAAWDS